RAAPSGAGCRLVADGHHRRQTTSATTPQRRRADHAHRQTTRATTHTRGGPAARRTPPAQIAHDLNSAPAPPGTNRRTATDAETTHAVGSTHTRYPTANHCTKITKVRV